MRSPEKNEEGWKNVASEELLMRAGRVRQFWNTFAPHFQTNMCSKKSLSELCQNWELKVFKSRRHRW
jgi:hypothetical protein